MNRKTRKFLKDSLILLNPLLFLLMIYVFINIIGLAAGLLDGDHYPCKITYNSDYFLPGRKLGCWLGSSVNREE